MDNLLKTQWPLGKFHSRSAIKTEIDKHPSKFLLAQPACHYITTPLVITRNPENGKRNIGMYRMQVHDPRTTGMQWQIGKGGGFHYLRAEALGRALPVTVLLLEPGAEDGFIRFWQPTGTSPERHVAYALQWFAFAATLATIWLVMFLKRRRRTDD